MLIFGRLRRLSEGKLRSKCIDLGTQTLCWLVEGQVDQCRVMLELVLVCVSREDRNPSFRTPLSQMLGRGLSAGDS
jgi:hypothetical protein